MSGCSHAVERSSVGRTTNGSLEDGSCRPRSDELDELGSTECRVLRRPQRRRPGNDPVASLGCHCAASRVLRGFRLLESFAMALRIGPPTADRVLLVRRRVVQNATATGALLRRPGALPCSPPSSTRPSSTATRPPGATNRNLIRLPRPDRHVAPPASHRYVGQTRGA